MDCSNCDYSALHIMYLLQIMSWWIISRFHLAIMSTYWLIPENLCRYCWWSSRVSVVATWTGNWGGWVPCWALNWGCNKYFIHNPDYIHQKCTLTIDSRSISYNLIPAPSKSTSNLRHALWGELQSMLVLEVMASFYFLPPGLLSASTQ